MKRFSTTLLILLLLLFCSNIASAMTVKELAEKVKTPEQLSFWMGRNIWYHYDKDKWGKEDYWQTPEETLSKENKYKEYSGDCEDFAILVRDVLKEWKINSTIIILTKRNSGHAICVFNYDDKIYITSNDELLISDYKTINEAVKEYFTEWKIKSIIIK